MSTPRKRYPSDDDRTLRQGGIRVSYEVLSPDPAHPEQAEVFEDPTRRGIWLGVLLKAGKAFAGRTQDTFVLSAGDLLWVTGEPRRDRAIAKLMTVCDRMGYAVRPHGGRGVAVHVKNLSQNQRWTTQTPRSTPAETPLSESESESESESSDQKTDPQKIPLSPPSQGGTAPPALELNGARTRKARGKAPRTLAPDRLEPDPLEALRLWCMNDPDPAIQKRAPWVADFAASCLDWHRSKGNLMADWPACVRTWIRRDAQDGKPVRPPPAPPQKLYADMTPEERIEFARRVREAEDRRAERRAIREQR